MNHAPFFFAKSRRLFSHEKNPIFSFPSNTLCRTSLSFKVSHDEQVAKTDFRMCEREIERASRCLGPGTFDLSEQGSPFCCHCVHRRGHLDSLSSPDADLIPKSHQVTPRRTEPLFFWIYITEPPPKSQRKWGKWTFQLVLMGGPWASWF